MAGQRTRRRYVASSLLRAATSRPMKKLAKAAVM
jgi:hypothetical protein